MPVDAKCAMRESIRRLLKEIPEAERAKRSLVICRSIAMLERFQAANSIMLYMPYSREVDVRPLIDMALGANKLVCLPVVTGDGLMDAVRIRDMKDMAPGKYGILCPSSGEVVPAESIELVITPGLAFDRLGGRLGKGGGYYDRFLAKTRAVAIAPAFCEQVVQSVPQTLQDAAIDILATERFVINVNNK